MLESLTIAFLLSLDAFAAGIACGADGIHIPPRSTVVVSAICSALLGMSLLLGDVVSPFISERGAGAVSFAILVIIGASKLFDSAVKRVISRFAGGNVSFKLFGFILNVYVNPQAADSDSSSTLSAKEAIPLAAAMSIDGLTVGFGVGIAGINAAFTVAASFVITALAVMLGTRLGKTLKKRTDGAAGWIGGTLLIIIAVFKLIS